MKIEVQYFAQVRQAAGCANESVELPEGGDIHALLAGLAPRHGEAFRAVAMDSAGDARPGIIVLVNDQPVARGDARRLSAGDRVSIFSPLAGG